MDWTPVTIYNTRASIKNLTGSQKTQPRVSDQARALRKVETSDVFKPRVLTAKSRSDLALARTTKGFTQKQLDQRCQFPANTCNGWEAGRACPTGPQLNIVQRVLGIKLEMT